MICSDSNLRSIPLNAIQSDNNYFKITKPLPKELIKSISQYGIIEPVVLLQHNEYYIPIYGHNRLAAAREVDMKDVPAKVITEFCMGDFYRL